MSKKSILISKEIHDNLKGFCQVKGLKLYQLVEKLIEKFLKEQLEDKKIK